MQIFISYKRQDEPFARQLRTKLLNLGCQVWLDVVDIPPGADWDTAIHQGMKYSDMVIGVLTPESVASRNVLDEWGYALSNKKPLLLLWLRDVPDNDIPPRYIRIQRIDFRTNHTIGWAKLKAELLNININAKINITFTPTLSPQRKLIQNWNIISAIIIIGLFSLPIAYYGWLTRNEINIKSAISTATPISVFSSTLDNSSIHPQDLIFLSEAIFMDHCGFSVTLEITELLVINPEESDGADIISGDEIILDYDLYLQGEEKSIFAQTWSGNGLVTASKINNIRAISRGIDCGQSLFLYFRLYETDEPFGGIADLGTELIAIQPNDLFLMSQIPETMQEINFTGVVEDGEFDYKISYKLTVEFIEDSSNSISDTE